MSKHIQKVKQGGNPTSGKRGGMKQQVNTRKIGESTAKRMQAKAKRPVSKAMQEEIDSDIGDDIDMDEVEQPHPKTKGKALMNDPFF